MSFFAKSPESPFAVDGGLNAPVRSEADPYRTRSLVALKDLQGETPDRTSLSARGIVEVFRSQRLTVDKFRNFTWGMPA